MQISEINYERRYAFAEMEAIIEHLGEAFKSKVPHSILRRLRMEKKQGYIPNFDFSKSLVGQVTRQETKNLMAYFYCNFWCENEEDKKKLELQIEKNRAVKKELDRQKRMEEIRRRAAMEVQSLDSALNERLKK
ncbi:MAG: hypothetical protein IJ217_02860 [Clostridia bacterium]|nr:hypothetical protein [Clostridia bacterium]